MGVLKFIYTDVNVKVEVNFLLQLTENIVINTENTRAI